MDKKVKVSVYCFAYNHEKYIRKTLEGFVNQKTDFKYEVIVHDDASTDNTAQIIKEFEEKYPDIIQGIYQQENQYSKKVSILRTFILPKLKGEYIAVCEGDDYWTDENKLQLQSDVLDNDQTCVMVSHNTRRITEDENFIDLMVQDKESGYCEPKEFINKNNKNPHLSSLMYRRILVDEIRPDFFKKTTGDNALRCWALTKGKIYYIDKVMSAYRVNTPGSWTQRVAQQPEKQRENSLKNIEFLNAYNEYTEYKFDEYVQKAVLFRQLTISAIDGDYKKAYDISKKLSLGFKIRFKYKIYSLFPFIRKIFK